MVPQKDDLTKIVFLSSVSAPLNLSLQKTPQEYTPEGTNDTLCQRNDTIDQATFDDVVWACLTLVTACIAYTAGKGTR